ncbi:MAG TPA: PepSY domain-containing protein [Polyangiaceae bacterium]|nr:PepSY domain-containing protein [Polyangiaceae bacterium]
MSAAQAIERARAAVDEEYRERLTMTMCFEEQSGWVWLVSEPAKGRVYSVEIDDATGEVLRAGFRGTR